MSLWLHFDRALVTWQLSLSVLHTLARYKIKFIVTTEMQRQRQCRNDCVVIVFWNTFMLVITCYHIKLMTRGQLVCTVPQEFLCAFLWFSNISPHKHVKYSRGHTYNTVIMTPDNCLMRRSLIMLCYVCLCMCFQRKRAVIVTRSVRGAVGARGPASVCPARLSNEALSV